MVDLSVLAINAALSDDWEKAVEFNTKILKTDENNTDCLNRLGKAYLELGENKKAVTVIKKVLKIDKYDAIATRNLARASQTSVKKVCANVKKVSQIDFLEEPGKTKLIALVNLAPAGTLLKQEQTDGVSLLPKRHTVVVSNSQDDYLGSLPDDVGHRLSVLIKGGNKYCAFIKSVSKSSLVVFVRETLRVKKFADTPSFIANSADYFSYIREETPNEPQVVETEGDDNAPISEKFHSDEEPEAA